MAYFKSGVKPFYIWGSIFFLLFTTMLFNPDLIPIMGLFRNNLHPLSFNQIHFPFGISSYLWPIVLFLTMIVGMLFNQYYEILKKRRAEGVETINIKGLFRDGLSGVSFWMAIFVAPIVFYSSYAVISTIPDNKVALFYAFQNGFFWQAIFSKVETSQTVKQSSAKKKKIIPEQTS